MRALAIPPAWTEVWISPSARGHIQATGRDARGRKQYRYHAEFLRRRDMGKFDRIVRFGKLLPRLRRRVNRDLRRQGLPREKVLAAVIRLMELTLLRVGNEEYARLNRSFGMSTLRNRHASVRGAAIRFRFRGKGGRVHEVGVTDRRLAAVVRRCQELPGQALFEYLERPDGGGTAEPAGTDSSSRADAHAIDSADVNDYIREALGDDSFSAKDLRTWAGTMLAFRALRSAGPAPDERGARGRVVDAIRETAEHLGNTPTVARASYVHPGLLEAYLANGLEAGRAGAARPTRADELALLRVLRRRKDSRRAASPDRKAPTRIVAPSRVPP